MSETDDTKKITEALYEHNLEISAKNKTLSLLEKLYQVSILTLTPEMMARTITYTIREDLNLEFSGVFIFKQNSDALTSIAFSKSKRLVDIFNKFGLPLDEIKIDNISTNELLNEVAYGKVLNMTSNLEKVFGRLIPKELSEKIQEESHIKMTLLYPLTTDLKVLGVLFLGLNRDYETLSTFEKDSIKSFINVIALSLDKAYLYKELKDANEKLKSLDKLKNEFLSLASHQIRSPLTAINGYTSMLLEGDFGAVNEKQKEMIDRIFESGKHLAQIIEDFLNISKIEQGGMKYIMQPFDFEKVVRDLATDLSISATKKGLKLTFENDNKQPYTVNGDMEKIRQVILNLIDNSIKYTQEGDIKIQLSKDKQLDKIRLSVSDTGMGIKPEIKQTLFQKFARGEGSKLNATGSGLGLYLARVIIEAHNGRVWVESEGEGKGSTFFVELDLKA